MIHNAVRRPVTLIATLAAAIPAMAAPAAAADCTLSTTGLLFGAYRPTRSDTDNVTATISVDCTATIAETVNYQIVAIAPKGSGDRSMRNGSGGLRYELYLSPSGGARWGGDMDGFGAIRGSMTLAAGEHRTANHHVYGRILHGQREQVGTYTDQILLYLIQNRPRPRK